MATGVYIEDGKVKVRVRISGRLIRRVVGPVNADNKRKAEAIYREIKNELAAAELRGSQFEVIEKLDRAKEPLKFTEAVDRFMAESQSCKMATRSLYEGILRNYLLPEFGRLKVFEIDAHRIAKYQGYLVTTLGKKGKPLSPTRVNTIIQLLRTILSHCQRDGHIALNPAVNVKRVQEPAAKIDPLSKDELEDVLRLIDPHYKALFTTLAFTGARPNELIALRWSDVDFRRKEIHISKGRVRGFEGQPKTKSANRILPMPPRVEAALRGLQESTMVSMDGYVFTDRKGLPILKHLDRIWSRALKVAGVRHRPSYQLRHTFASHCLAAGLSPGYVAKHLGHSTLETMYRHYARWIEDANKENQIRLMTLFAETTPKIEQVSLKVSF